MPTDELIDLLRTRAADPARRVDVPESELGAFVASMGLGDMLGMASSLAGGLARVVGANQAGRTIDRDLVERADDLELSMTTPVHTELPEVADPAALDRVESMVGAALPPAFRRVYDEVADGGIGPGTGLLSVEVIARTYRELLDDPPAPRDLSWPRAMVPIVDADPGYYCLELPSGRVVDWDPEGTSESQSGSEWMASFSEVAPDLETWLGAWVMAPTPSERREADMARLRREELRRTRERIAAMTPGEGGMADYRAGCPQIEAGPMIGRG